MPLRSPITQNWFIYFVKLITCVMAWSCSFNYLIIYRFYRPLPQVPGRDMWIFFSVQLIFKSSNHMVWNSVIRLQTTYLVQLTCCRWSGNFWFSSLSYRRVLYALDSRGIVAVSLCHVDVRKWIVAYQAV